MRKVLPARIKREEKLEILGSPILIKETKQERRQRENAEQKWALIQEAKRLQKQGYSLRRIAKTISCSWVTVRRYLAIQEPPSAHRGKRPKPLDAHQEHVISMIESGESIKTIYTVLTTQYGYQGTYGAVRVFGTEFRKKKKQGQPFHAQAYYSRRTIRRLLWQNPLAEKEKRNAINDILQQYPVLGPFYAFLTSFRACVTDRDAEGFRSLILFEKNREDPLTKAFINRLLTDFQPTLHALMNEDSNGYVEGQVNRLKMIKRLLYGRASFHLLRIRMLYRSQ
ncbi:transposase [Alkalicoccus urumqiensis]|uniref:Transposase IS204/IS1001/IS1096/IS1165 DDE domain-containing protein n=1 Tax=Alkalicoccus urumqiensis TaxID=1548213 RepID=A0A2P6MHT6_ALKUR|nr:hypothetical protein C6I21_08090 [Alkalicoccus urumqiensis]